ncbi:MAG: ComEC/Rec2 family competence protein [Candidatus Microsaccharimonas sp.]
MGVWLALYLTLNHWWLVLMGCGLVGIALWRRRLYVLPALVLGAGVIGLWYGSTSQEELRIYTPLIGSQVQLQGTVREDPSLNDKNKLVLQLHKISIDGHDLPGAIWMSVSPREEIKRGDEVTLEGKVMPGFGTFAAILYNARVVRLNHPQPGDIGRVMRDWFADKIRLAIPEPQASLGIGFLTGQKSALPGDLAEALQIAGLSHIVVASGYNLTILVRLARRLFMRISKFAAAMGSSTMIILFVMMTGLSPSMTRAGLVSGLSLLAWYYGRGFHPFVLLPFAAAITVAVQPSYVWGDMGWQLSFSAFAAVMIVTPLLQRYFFGEEKSGTIRQVLGETVGAHLVTLPIIVLGFGVISNVAIPANLLIVPFVPMAMFLTFISGLAGIITPGGAELVGMPASWLLGYMTQTAQYLAELPWAQTAVEVPWWSMLLYYAVMTAGCVWMQRATGFRLREVNMVE